MSAEGYENFLGGVIRLHKQSSGQKACVDSLLLAATTGPYHVTNTIDLGCGAGIISLALAHFQVSNQLVGVDIQPTLVELAKNNVALNGRTDSIRILAGDVRCLKAIIEPQSFDLAVCNPPYYPVRSGRLNPDPERAVARHEIAGGLGDFIRGARFALHNRGRLVVVYPAFRLPDLLSELQHYRFSVEWVQFVHPSPGREAKLVLAQARRGGAGRVVFRAPIWLADEKGAPTEPIRLLLEHGEPLWSALATPRSGR